MGSVGVVVLEVVAEQCAEVAGAEDDGAVEEFAADGADPSFGVAVRDGRVGRGADDGGAFGAEDFVEAGDELAGAVADQEPDGSTGT